MFGTTWLRHLCNNREEGEIETKWDILYVSTLMGIQMQTERYSRRQCTAEQTNQRVNNRTRGRAKQREECCVEFVQKKKKNWILPCHLKMQHICCYPSFTAHQMLFLVLESNNRVILPSCLTEIYISRKIFTNTDTMAVCAFIQIDLLVVAASLCAVPVSLVFKMLICKTKSIAS